MENQIRTLYYTPITAEPICSDSGEQVLAKATTTLSFDLHGKFIGVCIDGTTEDDAKSRLIDFFSNDEEIVLQLVE